MYNSYNKTDPSFRSSFYRRQDNYRPNTNSEEICSKYITSHRGVNNNYETEPTYSPTPAASTNNCQTPTLECKSKICVACLFTEVSNILKENNLPSLKKMLCQQCISRIDEIAVENIKGSGCVQHADKLWHDASSQCTESQCPCSETDGETDRDRTNRSTHDKDESPPLVVIQTKARGDASKSDSIIIEINPKGRVEDSEVCSISSSGKQRRSENQPFPDYDGDSTSRRNRSSGNTTPRNRSSGNTTPRNRSSGNTTPRGDGEEPSDSSKKRTTSFGTNQVSTYPTYDDVDAGSMQSSGTCGSNSVRISIRNRSNNTIKQGKKLTAHRFNTEGGPADSESYQPKVAYINNQGDDGRYCDDEEEMTSDQQTHSKRSRSKGSSSGSRKGQSSASSSPEHNSWRDYPGFED